MSILKYYYSDNYLLLYIFIHLVIYNIMMLLFGVVSYKVRLPRLVSYACLYTTEVEISYRCDADFVVQTTKLCQGLFYLTSLRQVT